MLQNRKFFRRRITLLLAVLLLAFFALSCADSHINVRGQYDFTAGYVKGLR
ncbi:MAG: hypothetical protein LBQ51_10250 [Desulfovibrio sp.]|nr:hypothetical protein [Desulfovibrio sp.]